MHILNALLWSSGWRPQLLHTLSNFGGSPCIDVIRPEYFPHLQGIISISLFVQSVASCTGMACHFQHQQTNIFCRLSTFRNFCKPATGHGRARTAIQIHAFPYLILCRNSACMLVALRRRQTIPGYWLTRIAVFSAVQPFSTILLSCHFYRHTTTRAPAFIFFVLSHN